MKLLRPCVRHVKGQSVGVQVWRQPKQAKKGKKGPERLPSSSGTVVESLSADIEGVHHSLASGLKVRNISRFREKAS